MHQAEVCVFVLVMSIAAGTRESSPEDSFNRWLQLLVDAKAHQGYSFTGNRNKFGPSRRAEPGPFSSSKP